MKIIPTCSRRSLLPRFHQTALQDRTGLGKRLALGHVGIIFIILALISSIEHFITL